MVPPESADWRGVRSLTSIGVAGVVCSGFGVGAGVGFWAVGCFLAAGFDEGDEDFEAVFGGAGSMTTPLGPTGRRSSSTEAVEGFCCHSSMAPSGEGVARSCSTGGGAAPAAAKASGEGPAEWPWALRICTRYARRDAGATVRAGGKGDA